jgi:glucose/arabinose dehydrogenase
VRALPVVPGFALLLLGLDVVLRAAAAPLPYVAEPAFPGTEVREAVALVVAPGDDTHLYVVEKAGRILAIDVRQPSAPAVEFLDLRRQVGDAGGEQGLLALAFHPDWKRNRRFFVWYTHTEGSFLRSRREDRLARFEISPRDPLRADPDSEQILIAQRDEASNHNGGQLLFGADGYLYVSLGDEGGANDTYGNSQRIDRDFFAGILRLDVDLQPGSLAPNPHEAVRPGTYAVPADNPFVDARRFNDAPVNPTAVRTEFWATGLRNPWRMAFDSATGLLWCGDVGQNRFEEIDVIERGGNYGWSYREGPLEFRGRAPAGVKFVEPVWSYPRSEGVSVTGGLVYRGPRHPGLDGRYVFADFASGKIWALQPDGNRPVGPERVRQIASVPGVVTFAVQPQTGDLLLASLPSRHLLRLVPRTPAAKK